MPIFRELPDISDEDASSVEGHEAEEEEVIFEDDAPHPFSQKELNDQLVKGLCQTVGIQIEGKKTPL